MKNNITKEFLLQKLNNFYLIKKLPSFFNVIKVILKSYSNLFFFNNKNVGIFILLLTFYNPNIGISGLYSILITILFAEILNLRNEYLENSFYFYNSLLVGMGIGFLFTFNLYTALLISLLSILTFLFSFFLYKKFSHYGIPILSLPFSFVTIIAYLSVLKYSNLFSNMIYKNSLYDIQLNCEILSGYFKSLGAIIFLPYNIVGLLIFFLLFYKSRILTFLSIIGYVAGILIHYLFVGKFEFYNFYTFNYLLISMALGGIFLIPNLKTYILSIIFVGLDVIFSDALDILFSMYSIPTFTLPFNSVLVLGLFLFYYIGYKYVVKNFNDMPELNFMNFYLSSKRFSNIPSIFLPFNGKWTVYQGFNSKWTHKGKWKYAYDFVIKKNGKTFQNEGIDLYDYYCYGKPILSPVNGYVIEVVSDIPDNPIGTVNRLNNWGNYVIIKSIEGYFIEISHFQQHSIKVKPGDYVEIGQIIGSCGNSGYSPEPHIHIQVQKYGILGSETIPFNFIYTLKKNDLLLYYNPNEEETIENVVLDKSKVQHFQFILDDFFKYEVFNEINQKIGEFNICVKMNKLGEFYFTDENNNKLYFYNNGYMFYFYKYIGNNNSLLSNLFKTVPRIPLLNIYGKKLKFIDKLPKSLFFNKIESLFKEFFYTFIPDKYILEFLYYFENFKITNQEGNYVKCDFYIKGFKEIYMRNIFYNNIKYKELILRLKGL